ncbi:MAG: hypothetical protein GHCLOJNM_02283 [bacterium]|nr:hypothetical protein [bacterium]
MSVHVALEMPEDAFSALRTNPENFAREMRLAAAVRCYELGMISQGKAAEIADLSRQEFMLACSRLGVSPFQTKPEELAEEFARE